jgi:glycogen synthase
MGNPSLNEELLAWLKADSVFKSGIAPVVRQCELAEQLFALEIHLLLWHAKYKVWIPGYPEHALVYMEDENQHGLGFPSAREVEKNEMIVQMPGVDEEVKTAVQELQSKWK